MVAAIKSNNAQEAAVPLVSERSDTRIDHPSQPAAALEAMSFRPTTASTKSRPTVYQPETRESRARRIQLTIPEGHKLIHVMRHAIAWHKYPYVRCFLICSITSRGEEQLDQIHDPGITPGGMQEVRLFTSLYFNLRNPTVVVTSPLRRCLQTALNAFAELIESGRVRVIAHPDLMEVSIEPCDTGTPLDRLREEFPQIQFAEDLFPDVWPRSGNIIPPKEGTIYDDTPDALSRRSRRVLEYVKNLDDTEVIIVTHGGFAHFLFDRWTGDPGDSESLGPQLKNGEARPMTLPGKAIDGTQLHSTGTMVHFGPRYPQDASLLDDSPEVINGPRDYGMFTAASLR